MSHFQLDDTIGALASAPGGAGRGIVRVGGPDVLQIMAPIFVPADASRWKSARFAAAQFGELHLTALRTPVPVLVYAWPTRHSYTGQPIVEIHASGSPPILEAILAHLFAAGVRPALAGEFTLRAFLNGRIDLVQAEAVLGVIDALDTRRLTTALRQLAGGISELIVQLRSGLLDLLADLEAGLDFVEEDIQFVSRGELSRRLAAAEREVAHVLLHSESRTQSTGCARVVLAGLPNAGKSTLFNALAGRNAALVSATSGTTRDYLRATLEWSGITIELVDTAGWESAGIDHATEQPTREPSIFQAAQLLRESQCEEADLVVWCSACDQTAAVRFKEETILERLHGDGRRLLLLHTKADLKPAGITGGLAVSAIDRAGITELVEVCVGKLAGSAGQESDMIGTTAARCRESLIHCRESLSRARVAVDSLLGDELLVVEIREAVDHLGRILGAIYTDDILDRVFRRFCIGK
jgi:tRNA modification GTPase